MYIIIYIAVFECCEMMDECKDECKEDCGGEPEPDCFSSFGEFRYRVWEFLRRCRYVLCGC